MAECLLIFITLHYYYISRQYIIDRFLSKSGFSRRINAACRNLRSDSIPVPCPIRTRISLSRRRKTSQILFADKCVGLFSTKIDRRRLADRLQSASFVGDDLYHVAYLPPPSSADSIPFRPHHRRTVATAILLNDLSLKY